MDQKGKDHMTVTAEGLSEALVTEAIEAVVAEKGEDFVYDVEVHGDGANCLYVKDGQPSCIVGHVMARLGYPLDMFIGLEGQTPITGPFLDVFSGLPGHVAAALNSAQIRQDGGKTWGESLDAYKKYLSQYNNEMENNNE